jgi:hypothetical protein
LLAQSVSYLKDAYVRTTLDYQGSELVVSTFSRKKTSKGKIKAKYFAQQANQQFAQWKVDKHILYYCSGAFSESWDTNSPPLGICVDNGKIVNRNIDESMDGLVIVYNGGAQAGGIAVINLDKEQVNVNQGGTASYDLRNVAERNAFLRWASAQSATVFQTQLMYSKSYDRGYSPSNLTHGETAERRFLAICMKEGVVYHLVIEHPESDYLNRAAERVIHYLLDAKGYLLFGLFNLDTGGKNVMRAYDEDGQALDNGPKDVREATNLLIYYVE